MKTKTILTVIALLVYVSNASAETCTTTTTSTPAGPTPSQAKPYIQYCSDVSYTNYYWGSTTTGNAVYSTPQCTACKKGYQLFTFYNDGTTGTDWTSTCESYNPSFTICAKPCDSNCVSADDDWGTDATGYECHQHKSCLYAETICQEAEFCRCESGYYGYAKVTDGGTFSGCTKCPTTSFCSYASSKVITDPDDWDTEITDCFVSKTSACLSDDTGRYKCSEDVYYKL